MRIQSLDRAISILNLFTASRNPIGISEMADSLGLAKTTVHGLVTTLVKNGFLQKDSPTRKYRLGFALYELGSIQISRLEINQRATGPLQNLANKINRICRVAVWDRNSIIVTMTIRPQGHESTQYQFGPRLPGYCTALGKAILANMGDQELTAYLDITQLIAYTPFTIIKRKALEKDLLNIKKRGYSLSCQEVLIHQVGLGAPILISDSEIAGSISMRLDPEDQDTEIMTNAADLLMRTARQISMEMGYQPMNITYNFT